MYTQNTTLNTKLNDVYIQHPLNHIQSNEITNTRINDLILLYVCQTFQHDPLYE